MAEPILVRRAKNDPFGDGRWAYLPIAAASHMERWLLAARVGEGPIFRPVICGHVQPGSLRSLVVNRTLKAAAARAGLPPATLKGLSGHSMRVGAAQDLMVAGRGILQIMNAGGWTSINVVGRYVREADLNVWGTLESGA